MIDINEHFDEGTEGYEAAFQAISQLDLARKAGLNEEADRLESGLLQSILTLRKSGGSDISGFNSVRQSINGLTPQIKGKIEYQNQYSEAKGTANTLYEMLKASGPVEKAQSDAIENVLNNGGPNELKTTSEQIKNLIDMKVKQPAASQTKPEIKPVELNPFQQQRVLDIAAMKGKTQEELKDPVVYGDLAKEVEKRDMAETQARKIFRRLGAARELLTNSEAMNEFGDSMPTNWVQRLFATSDDALQTSLLGQLKGGDLAQGMAEVKAATGTAAGMAVEETKALANSISALNTDLNYKDAQKKLKQVIDDAKFALGRLGVDPLTYSDKKASDRVLSNQEKYLFRDERDYQNKRVPTSGSGSIATQRLGEMTRQNLPMSTKIIEDNGNQGYSKEPLKFELPQ